MAVGFALFHIFCLDFDVYARCLWSMPMADIPSGVTKHVFLGQPGRFWHDCWCSVRTIGKCQFHHTKFAALINISHARCLWSMPMADIPSGVTKHVFLGQPGRFRHDCWCSVRTIGKCQFHHTKFARLDEYFARTLPVVHVHGRPCISRKKK